MEVFIFVVVIVGIVIGVIAHYESKYTKLDRLKKQYIVTLLPTTSSEKPKEMRVADYSISRGGGFFGGGGSPIISLYDCNEKGEEIFLLSWSGPFKIEKYNE